MSREHFPQLALIAVCLLILPIQFGQVPPLAYSWGYNLWLYLPGPATLGLAALVILACIPPVARRVADAAANLWQRLATIPSRPLGIALLLALPFLFWVLRERQFFGDSNLILLAAITGWQFSVPDVGATYLIGAAVRLGNSSGMDIRVAAQLLVCCFGTLAVASIALMSRYVAPSAERRAVFVALVLCGGIFRVFVGHVEVYSFVLVCGAAYIWSSLAYLNGKCHANIPSLILGVGIWLHLSFGFLVPSLIYLLLLANPDEARADQLKRIIIALFLTGIPMLLFLLLMFGLGHTEDLIRAGDRTLQILGIRESQGFKGGSFLRLPGNQPIAGTDYVIFSWAHWKYLINAFFILTPFAIPTLLAVLATARQTFGARPETRFLTAACISILSYTCIVRPVWGPHDWDMFTLTAFCLATLAAHLLVNEWDTRRLGPFAATAILATVAFVTVPFLTVAIHPEIKAGPFAHGAVTPEPGDSPWDRFYQEIADWL